MWSMLVRTLSPFSEELSQVTMTCKKRSVTQAMEAVSSTKLPTSTGARNCTSSISVTVGRVLVRNLEAQSHPTSQPTLRMCPPKILPLRFLSSMCISRLFLVMVELIDRQHSTLPSLSFFIRLWITTDSSQVGGAISSPRLASSLLPSCLSCPISLMILNFSLSASRDSLGTAQDLPVFWLRATMTKLAEQASRSVPSKVCRTSMWTSIELVPTQETQPERRQSVSLLIGQQNSIWSMAAVTTMNSRESRSICLAWSVVQQRQATLAAMQSISSSSRPTRMFELEN